MRLDGRAEKKVPKGKRRRRGSKASAGSNHPNSNAAGSAHRRLFQGDKKPRGVGGVQKAGVQKELMEKMRKQFDVEAKRKVQRNPAADPNPNPLLRPPPPHTSKASNSPQKKSF